MLLDIVPGIMIAPALLEKAVGNRCCDRVWIVELLLDSAPDIKIAPALLEIAARNQGYDCVRYRLLGLWGLWWFRWIRVGLPGNLNDSHPIQN